MRPVASLLVAALLAAPPAYAAKAPELLGADVAHKNGSATRASGSASWATSPSRNTSS